MARDSPLKFVLTAVWTLWLALDAGAVSRAGSAGAAGAQPPAVCAQLEEALARYRGIAAGSGWPAIGDGPSLRPGATDPRIGRLRERLAIGGDLPDGAAPPSVSASDTTLACDPTSARDDISAFDDASVYDPAFVYDAATEAGVRQFQARHSLTADGIVGPATLAALNVPAHERVSQIATAVDRCRSDLRDLPDRFIVVNVAGFRVLFVEHGRMTWSSRVIVGTPDMPTPMFRAPLQYIDLNPTWTVPKSIVEAEVLPHIRRDPDYLSKMGMKRVGNGYVQMPGPTNVLGGVKLIMPNRYDVYMHDTPGKSLFSRAVRTFSHGCIRVEKPVELAALALDDPEWSEQALQRAIQTGRTRRILLHVPIPVVVTSWPAFVDREGTIEFLPDPYRKGTAMAVTMLPGNRQRDRPSRSRTARTRYFRNVPTSSVLARTCPSIASSSAALFGESRPSSRVSSAYSLKK